MSYKEYLKRKRFENELLIRTLLYKHAVVILIVELIAYLFLRFAMRDSVFMTVAMAYLILIGGATVACWVLLLLAYLWEKWDKRREEV